MKGVLILLVTAIVVCVGNRTQGVHRHRHGKTGHKPERDTESIILKPGTAKNKLFPGKQQQRINTTVEELRNDDNKIRNDLRQHRNELLMYGRYNLNVINTINALHDRQTYSERAVKQRDFNFRKSDMDVVNYNFDVMMYMENAREEHVVTYREAVKAASDFLDGIAIVTQGRLPKALISDNQLREILGKVDAMVKRNYPDYVLVAAHISHYRDMKMVTFAVDQQTHSLIVTFPAFIKNYKQPPLSLYEVETVPVPIIDKNVKANSYSQVRIYSVEDI